MIAKFLKMFLILIGTAFTLVCNPALAQNAGIMPINPVPSQGLESNQNSYYRAHIDELSGVGIIQRVGDDMIVIGDSGFKPAAYLLYYNLRGFRTTSYYFGVGQRAGYVLNDRREIVSLWEVEEVK